jgi:hypothetical protein
MQFVLSENIKPNCTIDSTSRLQPLSEKTEWHKANRMLGTKPNNTTKIFKRTVPRLRKLVAGPSPWRPDFDCGPVHVGFVVDKVALGQGFPRVLRFSPLNFIPPVLRYKEKRKKKLIIFITGLHNKPQDCGASVPSAVGPFKINI